MTEPEIASSVTPIDIEDELRKSFLEYSMSVIVARALPDVRDGLKPVHRRILYAMSESGLTPNRAYKKSAWTVGEVIGKYHPHGDSAVYDTMVRMAQNWAMRAPLVDGHGNFGSVDGDSAAAMRYTESRLARPAMELLRDLEKETVDFGPNYDESLKEPLVLPARYPNLLVNGSAGIAVGMATNIPPHNLREVVDAACALIDDPEITLDGLMQHIHGPDFPTGGMIMGREGIVSAYETGRGSIKIRGKAHVEQTSTGRMRIIITEIPYTVNKSKLVSKIAELVREKKLPEISDLRDESDRKGMRVVVELKQTAIPQVVLNKLFKHTPLETGQGIIQLALVDGVPKELSLKQMLFHYVEHQKDVIVRRTRYDLRKAEERAHILEGYMIALDNIDEVIKIIRGSQDDAEAKARLIERFGLSEAQTDAILEMRLRRLTGLERSKIEDELAELRERIAWFKKVLADESLVLQIIKDEMCEIKEKYGDKRRTEISGTARDLDVEDLIAEEDMVVTITKAGYVKRLPVATYRQQRRGGKGISGVNLKDSDFVEQLFISSTHDYVLFFSTKGKVYRLKVHELPVGSRHARGTAVVNLLPFEQDERIAAAITTREFSADEHLLFATSHGMVKKTAIQAYDRSRRDGIIAINLRDGDELIAVRRVKEGQEVMMVSSQGKAIKWSETDARPMGRDTMGVRGMNVQDDDRVLGMEIAYPGSELFVVTERGYGKRTPVDQYPTQKRGGMGVKTIQVTEKKGRLAGMKIVMPGHELMLISEEGVVIRVRAEDISQLGRSTQGVKVMNVAGSDRVSAIARVSAKKKRPAAAEGQQALLEEAVDQVPGLTDREAEAEELVSEDFGEEE
ncbi:DNA gyrase subunit A [Anaerosoma tenue]|uniref:DNA gyrase subunit A n=1 Tax=Anaerosoma tenue TaxID=2933588 RepID=UPI00226093CE|nr:DNA gyrase subunit A [Anaerosoma tenue]MCK8115188.1 DNA gyrase subunit A [Anaerosoma tenue]